MRKSSVNGCFHRESRVDSQLDLTNALNLFLFFFFKQCPYAYHIWSKKVRKSKVVCISFSITKIGNLLISYICEVYALTYKDVYVCNSSDDIP